MKLFLMRHGEADLLSCSDFSRPLTARGYSESYKIANWLRIKNINIQQALVSPYLRAQQTLSVLCEVFPLITTNQINTLHELRPSGESSQVLSYLRLLNNKIAQSVIIISHLPFIHSLLTEIFLNESKIILPPSSIAYIDLHFYFLLNKLQWIISPKEIPDNA
ncbi:phosphohistidine phosphatase SixA [Candidatus Erwinia haradaeae]|uniref:Phosphohistidine phosphatase SixA n=1 Tax=Candidatus Erwinia haradaeae TaxID=1922217 RepID=A0A451D365_9GAMM|nr:phosphohistidine phosphatase SixA [Candidatus Erwinia haradaeae]VFP80105.1 Phosphohistidine phosphatase SixA [Candidatus Erwinia haradaeae]